MNKVNLFFSVVKAASAWLHGEGSSHFRAYTYPRIKTFTRRFVNFGVYEQVEKLYKIVDDTFYKGDLLEEQTLIDTATAEAKADLLEDGEMRASGSLLKWSAVKSRVTLWKGLEQGKTYRCGTFTMNNMLRSVMLKRSLKPELQVTAIDPLYIATKNGKGKTGTVMDKAFRYLSENGYPTPSWSPLMTNHDKELTALENSEVIGNAKYFSTVKTTGNVKKAYTYEAAVALDRDLPDNWEMQVSIAFSQSLRYFRQLVPYIRKVNGKYNLTRTGGHSVHGVRGSFSEWEDGEEGFTIIDSAYAAGEEGWRFIKARLFVYGIVTIRFVEYAVEGEVVDPTPSPTPEPAPVGDEEILSTQKIQHGDRGEDVKALQRFLIGEGYEIPAGVTGNFYKQTATALSAWQTAQFGSVYTGHYWGALSIKKYKEIKGL